MQLFKALITILFLINGAACCNGGDSCCTTANPCIEGEGDCDKDAHCLGSLQCGKNNCVGETFDKTDDCCEPGCIGGDSCCTSTNQCTEGEGDCDRDSDCVGSLKCGYNNCGGGTFDSTDDCCEPGCIGGDSCCTSTNQCTEGEGDCDRDSDCVGSLVCGYNNCVGEGFDSTDDCCEPPPDCIGGDSCCTTTNLCTEGEGDCDKDDQCAGSLVCGYNNCVGATFDSTDDCCEPGCNGGDSCCTTTNPCTEGEGDCDRDDHCLGSLVCGTNNCDGETFDSTDDCCEPDPGCNGGDSCCTATNLCTKGEGDCDRDYECIGSLVCGKDNCVGATFDSTDDCCEPGCLGGDSCCTPTNPCTEGEGDCDRDTDCFGSLVCGKNNCVGEGFDSTDDCCVP